MRHRVSSVARLGDNWRIIGGEMRAFIVDHVRIAKRVSYIFGDKYVIDTHI